MSDSENTDNLCKKIDITNENNDKYNKSTQKRKHNFEQLLKSGDFDLKSKQKHKKAYIDKTSEQNKIRVIFK